MLVNGKGAGYLGHDTPGGTHHHMECRTVIDILVFRLDRLHVILELLLQDTVLLISQLSCAVIILKRGFLLGSIGDDIITALSVIVGITIVIAAGITTTTEVFNFLLRLFAKADLTINQGNRGGSVTVILDNVELLNIITPFAFFLKKIHGDDDAVIDKQSHSEAYCVYTECTHYEVI